MSAAFAAALIGAAIIKSFRDQATASFWVSHTLEVLLRSSDLELQMQTAISEGRGWHLNHNADAIAPFNDAFRKVTADVAMLRGLIADNPRQVGVLHRLDSLIAERLRILQGNSGLKAEGVASMPPATTPAETRRVMTRVVDSIEDLEHEEITLLALRRRDVAHARQRSMLLVGLGGVLLSSTAWLAILLARSRRESRQHSADLTGLTHTLNRRVTERTLELAMTADALRDREAGQKRYLEHAPFAMSIVKRRPDGAYVYKFLNPAWESLYGYDRATCLEKTLSEVWPPSVAAAQTLKLAACSSVGDVFTFTIRNRQDRGIRHGEGTLLPLGPVEDERCEFLVCAKDLTAQHALECTVARQVEALQQSEARQRQLFEATPAMLLSIDRGGRVEAVSDAWLEGMGFARQNVVTRNVLRFMPPDSRRYYRNSILPELQENGRVAGMHCQARRRDGSVMDIAISATLERDEAGVAARVNAVIEDVTRRQQAERALVHERERLANLIAATGVGTWEWNVHTGALLMNARYRDMFGWQERAPSTIDMAVASVHPDEVCETRERLRQLLDGERDEYEHERRIRHDDGHYVWVLSRARVMVRLPDGRPEWIIGALQDISERKRHAALLEESEANFRLIAENSKDMISRVGPQGQRLYVSAAAMSVFGVTVDAFMASDAMARIHPDDRSHVESKHSAMRRGEITDYTVTFRVLNPARAEVWAESAVKSLKADGSGGHISVTRDVTERVQQEAERAERAREWQAANIELDRLARHMSKARQAAEQANRAKTRFLAGMSHELRTPLNGILGHAQLLCMEGGLTPRQAARADGMLKAGTHLLEMISSVLDLSGIESGNAEVQRHTIDVLEMSEACLGIVRPGAEAKSLSVLLDMAPDAPRRIVSDPSRLRQILLNLLGNAVKYTQTGGVWLRVSAVRADTAAACIRFDVVDTGPGIPQARRHLLFEEFERLGEGEAGTTEGAGLGLYLARRLAVLLGGALRYEDHPGGGSVFRLDLPGEDAGAGVKPAGDAASGSAASIPAAGGPPASILIVDDVAMNREIAASFARAAGFDPVCAADGATAVSLAGSQDFHVILMDVRMPGMDGLEATRRIRTLPGPRALTPIVALTAQAFTEQIEACRAAGMDDHLAKPFTLETLQAAIARSISIGETRRRAEAPNPGSDLPIVCEATYDRTAAFLSSDALKTYLSRLISRMEELHNDLATRNGGTVHAQSLVEVAHEVAGSAGLFGCELLVFAARHLEEQFILRNEASVDALDRLADAIEATLLILRAKNS